MTNKQSPFKVILCGESAVGKTTLMGKLSGLYNGIPDPTMSCNFSNITAQYNGKEVDMSFWDTAGQEQYRSLVKIFFRGADIVVFVCDLTSKLTLNSLEFWIEEAIRDAGDIKPAGILVANKTDLRDNIEITDDDLNTFSKNHKIIWMKVSAFSGENLLFLKNEIARICFLHHEDPTFEAYQEPNNQKKSKKPITVNLTQNLNDNNQEKKNSCC